MSTRPSAVGICIGPVNGRKTEAGDHDTEVTGINEPVLVDVSHVVVEGVAPSGTGSYGRPQDATFNGSDVATEYQTDKQNESGQDRQPAPSSYREHAWGH